MTYSCFELESKEGRIAHIRFNRPEKRNALSASFWSEFPTVVKELDRSGQTRVLVISSSGPHFTAGLDLSVFRNTKALKNDTPVDRECLRGLALMLQDALSCLEHSRMPVLAAVQGGCLGAGLALLCACDLRYATTQASFCIQETNIGVMADLGVLQRLPRFIPEAVVRELAYSGDALPAARACELGFVSATFETQEAMLDKVMQIAAKIGSRPPLVVAGIKEMIT